MNMVISFDDPLIKETFDRIGSYFEVAKYFEQQEKFEYSLVIYERLRNDEGIAQMYEKLHRYNKAAIRYELIGNFEKANELRQKYFEIDKLNKKDAKRSNCIFQPKKLSRLYHITTLENLSSIIQSGIMSRNLIERLNITPDFISNSEIMDNRKTVFVEQDKNLHHYANTYFQPRNSMLYSLVKEQSKTIIVIEVNLDLFSPGIFVSDGNAVNSQLISSSDPNYHDYLVKFEEKVVNTSEFSGTVKRQVMAECLVPDIIESKYVKSVHIHVEDNTKMRIQKILQSSEIDLIDDPYMFCNVLQ